MNKKLVVKTTEKAKAIARSIENIRNSTIQKFELPKIDYSDCLFINCKYYNIVS